MREEIWISPKLKLPCGRMRMTDQKYLYALHGAGLSAPTFTLSNQVYNYKDPLIEKNIGYRGVNNALQSIDYQYNTRGWLTAINGVGLSGGTSSLLTPSMQGTGVISQLAITPYVRSAIQQQLIEALPPMDDNNLDLLSQTLTYDNPDSRTGAAPQKNGNISSTVWQVAGRDRQAYGFKYDDLNRLTEANYYDIVGSQNTFSTDNKFNEKLTYDLRGNITTLVRKGLNGGSWTSNGYTAGTYGLIDNMVYKYGTGNRLSQVTDYSLADKGFKYKNTRTAPSEEDYRHDANGNLIWDRHKNISSIEYNYLNLPLVIRFTHPTVVSASGSIEFVYDATGVKLRKIVKNQSGTVLNTYDYVNGVEYKDQVLQRVAHSEGAVVRNEHGAYQHEFVLRDHLGNTRVTFRDGINKGEPYDDWSNGWFPVSVDPNANNPTYNDGVVTKEDIVQINHFYPFGLNMEGDWNGAQGKNKYQYNGKEWNDDFGLGLNDYGFRMYDPMVGRWWVQDPLTDSYPDITSYHYAVNNPINFIDEMGLDTAKPTVLPTVTVRASLPECLRNARGGAILSFPNSLNRVTYASASHLLEAQYGGDRFSEAGVEKRYQYKNRSRNATLGATKKVLNKIEPVKRKSPPTRYWKTNLGVNVAGVAGVGLGAYGLYQSAENIANAENPVQQTAVEAGGWAGALLGAEAAAPVAAYVAPMTGPLAPVVAVVIVGVGGAVGSMLGIKVIETVTK
jgi:RHS repeat-associated protein